MPFQLQHDYRFDAAGKHDADDWLLVPRAELRPNFVLDAALADGMAQRYFDVVRRASPLPVRVTMAADGVRLRGPLGKTALVLVEPERTADAAHAETSWRIAGGFVLAHRVNYGGRFYIGAEWQADGALKVYTSIRRFPPRLVNYFGVPRGIAVYRRTQGRAYQNLQTHFLNELAARLTT